MANLKKKQCSGYNLTNHFDMTILNRFELLYEHYRQMCLLNVHIIVTEISYRPSTFRIIGPSKLDIRTWVEYYSYPLGWYGTLFKVRSTL